MRDRGRDGRPYPLGLPRGHPEDQGPVRSRCPGASVGGTGRDMCRPPFVQRRAERAVLVNSAVKDVMTKRVVAVGETATFKEIIVAMRERLVSACPVVDRAGRVIGVVSEADLLLKEVGPETFTGPGRSLRASGRHGERAKAAAATAAELMSTPP